MHYKHRSIRACVFFVYTPSQHYMMLLEKSTTVSIHTLVCAVYLLLFVCCGILTSGQLVPLSELGDLIYDRRRGNLPTGSLPYCFELWQGFSYVQCPIERA